MKKLLTEGTSNFGRLDPLPLLVFYTYDEILERMSYDGDYPNQDDFYDEEGNFDEPAYYEAVEKFEQDYFDKIDICILDDRGTGTGYSVDDLEDDLDELNKTLEHKANDLEDEAWERDNSDEGISREEYDKLMDAVGPLHDIATFSIEPGYYEAAYIDNKYPESYNDLTEEDKKFVMDKIYEIKKKYGLTSLGVSYRFSNGETGYHKIEDESLKEEFNWEKVSQKVYNCLHKKGIYEFSTFTRPDNHFIIETRTKNREEILNALKECGFDVIENDDWCGGNRLGIIVEESLKESVGESVVGCPNMSFEEMKDYCDIYQCEVKNTGVKGKYKLIGKDVERVVSELKSDGFINEAIEGTPKASDYKKIAKKHLNSNKKGARGTFERVVNTDPEKNMKIFNHMMGSDTPSGEASVGGEGAACGESLEVNEGAEGKKVPGKEYVIYRTDLEDKEKAPIVAIRSTRTEAESVARFNKKYSSLNYEEVPKGKFKVGDDFYGPFDAEWNKNESLNEAKDEERVEHYQSELDKLGATEEECNKYIKIADDYESKAERHFITYEQMDEVAKAMGLEQMSDNELARAWKVCYYTLNREAFKEDNSEELERWQKYSDAASAFAEVINREARARKEKGNYTPKKGESLDLDKIIGDDFMCDSEGLLYIGEDTMMRIIGEAKDRGISLEELMKMEIGKEDKRGNYGYLKLSEYEDSFNELWNLK